MVVLCETSADEAENMDAEDRQDGKTVVHCIHCRHQRSSDHVEHLLGTAMDEAVRWSQGNQVRSDADAHPQRFFLAVSDQT